MGGLLSLLEQTGDLLAQKNADAILDTNVVTSQYGLTLTREDVVKLLNTRDRALADNDRIELGQGVIDRIILAFCDSPYLNCTNYADTLCALTELFYYMKNDTLDQMPDDELIQRMKEYFNGEDKGSLELLAGRELEQMARNIRTYGTPDAPEEPQPPVQVDDSGEYLIEEDGQWRTLQL